MLCSWAVCQIVSPRHDRIYWAALISSQLDPMSPMRSSLPGQLQVEKQVQQMAVLLSSVVQSPASPPGSVVEAVKHLLQLRADGAACAEQLDPVHMCLQSKVIQSGRRKCTCSQQCT